MNKQFNRYLRLGYGISLLILIVVGIICYRTLNNLLESDRAVSQNNLVMQKLEMALSSMKDAETGQRGYLLTGKQRFLEPYQGAAQRALHLVDGAGAIAGQRQIAEIRQIIQDRMTILSALIAKKKAGLTVTEADLNAGKTAMDTLRHAVDQANEVEQRLLMARSVRLNHYRTLMPVLITIALALAAAVAVYSYFKVVADLRERDRLYRELGEKEQETAAFNEELTAANEEITAANEELTAINEELVEAREELAEANTTLEQRVAERTEELAASEEETQALNEELTAMNEELAATNEELLSANKELTQAEERSGKLAAIVESSDDAIIGKTLDGIITSWNIGAERIFGYTEDFIVGKSILELVPEHLQHEEPVILEQLGRGERIDHYETVRRTSDGRLIDVALTISPIRNKAGEIIGVSKIARDISEQKQLGQRKSDFIGIASHELKTPLTSANALVQVLEQKLRAHDDPFVPSALSRVHMQLRKMTGMINGFLNVSRLESGKLHIDKSRFELNELIRETIAELELTISSHTFILSDIGTISLEADRDKIGSVLSNLLSNAVKYSPRGKLIRIGAATQGNEALLSIQDEGMGIKAEDRENIFDRYYRVSSEHTRQISGFGIGLYVSAEIVQRHGGRIWVESEKGIGSTFYFTLPLEE